MLFAAASLRKKAFQSPAPLDSSQSQAEQGKVTTSGSARTRGFCGGVKDCMSMGSIVSISRHQHQHQLRRHRSTSKLEQQVKDLEMEVQRQIELRIIYRKKMERTQEYLRYCLQTAQDNGLLEIMLNNNENGLRDQNHLTPIIGNISTSPKLQTSVHQHHDLSVIINQAQINGWYIHPQEIELHEKIGQGSTAEIYRGIWRGLDVAVKCITPGFFCKNINALTFFAQELETLSRQRHRFVLQLMGACLDPPTYGWVVTECLRMTLKEWLHGSAGNKRSTRVKERIISLPPFEERLTKALEISQAMQYLHEQKPKVIHRDLKPSNIFLDDSLHVRVADFGHARFLNDQEMALTGETGTYVYMAPEVIRCEPYNEKCDVYSFGIILNELITGNHPYIETDYGLAKIALEVGEGMLRPVLPEDDGKLTELIDFICVLWDGDAAVRPSFTSVTRSLRYFQNKLTCTS